MIVINIIGISILSIFLLFVFQKKQKRTSDYMLILTIILFAGMLVSDILIKQGLTAWKYIFQLLITTYLFPSFLIYGMVLIDKNHKIRKSWWWIPSYAIVFTAFIIIDFGFLNAYETHKKITQLFESPPFIYQVFYKSQYLFVILVLFWFLKKLESYKKEIKDQYSFIEPIHLNWFSNFTYTYLILTIFSLLLFLSLDFGLIKDINIPFAIVYTAFVIALFYLCYHGIRQYSLAEFQSSQSNTSSSEEKYKSSSLSDNDMNLLYNQIKTLFNLEKLYLEPQLKIEHLAEKLDVTTHKISQTINSKAHKPFFDFVNGYRVNHFKNLLSNPENKKYTILALGIESGFNSKASMNRIFKQYAGKSPREFQKAHFIV
jgi:AraC-like DNA-binding protein